MGPHWTNIKKVLMHKRFYPIITEIAGASHFSIQFGHVSSPCWFILAHIHLGLHIQLMDNAKDAERRFQRLAPLHQADIYNYWLSWNFQPCNCKNTYLVGKRSGYLHILFWTRHKKSPSIKEGAYILFFLS